MKPPQNVFTVMGESIHFQCIVYRNLDASRNLISYWGIIFPPTEHKRSQFIYYNNSELYPYYRIAHYQACSTDNESCWCSFVSKLIILNATLELNGTTFSCIEYLDGNKPLNRQKNATLSKHYTIASYLK